MKLTKVKLTIDISEDDIRSICSKTMTIDEFYNTTHGRIYRAIARAAINNGIMDQLMSRKREMVNSNSINED